MSTIGKANEIRRAYKDFIQRTALRGQLDQGGNLLGTRKITGYVAKIHEDDDDELKGTIDVQEFNYDSKDYEEELDGYGFGYHEGVKLCATQTNAGGVLIVPLMFSEVVITQNPSDQEEYVIAWSHAKAVQVSTHETIHLGVIEYKDFVETDNGLEKDYNELEETGKKTSTDYTAESIKDEVTVDGEGLVQEKTFEKKTIEVGDTKILIDGTQITIETSGNVTFKVGDTVIDEKDGTIDIKTDTANIETSKANVKSDDVNVEGNNIKVKGSNVEITGGKLKVKGASTTDLNGPFNAIKVCPFSGAPHCGSMVSGT